MAEAVAVEDNKIVSVGRIIFRFRSFLKVETPGAARYMFDNLHHCHF